MHYCGVKVPLCDETAYSICSMVSITIIPPKGPRSAALEASDARLFDEP